MLLVIDIGNTHTVLGLFSGDTLVDHWRVATDARRTADELGFLIRGLLAQARRADGITGVSCCSTVPAALREVRTMSARWFPDAPLVVVEPGIRTGVPVLYDNPREVGADRIVNTLAAFTLHGGPAIVVDFGTSTNFDVVSARGEFLGGVLAPGIDISIDALASRAAQLVKVQVAKPRSVIGKNTVEALQAGIVYGFAAQVDGIVTRIAEQLPSRPVVIATGGLAPVVLDECRTVDVHDPWLTLTGLRLIFERNVPE
ncbi:MAG: type III pantothenate kinase [Acidothermus cellulolyticus]|nr:type III pantothenate kinase [Acidothermus cellulolyticus]MCL6549792.1 type III pantothenate kinase [Acidothermus cellulolyticus]